MNQGMPNFISAFLLIYSLHFQDPSGFWIKSVESDTHKIYFKSKYISKVGSKITIWVKFEIIFPEEIDGKKETEFITLNECNCSNYSYKNLAIYSYFDSGESAGSSNINDPELKYAAPGSVAFGYINEICKRFNKKKK